MKGDQTDKLCWVHATVKKLCRVHATVKKFTYLNLTVLLGGGEDVMEHRLVESEVAGEPAISIFVVYVRDSSFLRIVGT